ncbi:MAG: family 43 glycosylhydrolase [Williamsia sp.]|nr:family 43 glycosylhydrolase [Williamsia sp.]
MIRILSSNKKNHQPGWPVYLLGLFFLFFSVSFVRSTSFPEKSATHPSRQKSTGFVDRTDSSQRKENPVIPGDFADPSVIRSGKIYYATGTSSEWAPHFPLFQSTDLLHWKQTGYVFKQTPSWAAASFWAPELFYWKGTYYVYYVARKKKDGISCIGVATAKDPSKGFTDHGILLEFGKEAIDPFVIEEKGKLYITWKAYGLDQRPIEILGSRLSDDGFKLEGEPFSLLRDDEKKGLEGQCLVKRGAYYYLFYSVGNCCGTGCSYKVEVAKSAALQGPYTKFENNPLLTGTDEWKCTGHGTLVSSQEGKDFYLYHAYSKTDDVYTGRQGMLAKVDWNVKTGWPFLYPVESTGEMVKSFRDDFSSAPLSSAWQWDFRHAQPHTELKAGSLYLSGQASADNPSGTAVTVRPVTGHYDIKTEVANRNAALKGLVLYGDAGQAVGMGVKDDVVQVWEVKKDKRSVVKEEKVGGSKPVQLKIEVEKGSRCRFYWSEDGNRWKELSAGAHYYNGSFLPPWDRSPRPGLILLGTEKEEAVFSFFEIAYR